MAKFEADRHEGEHLAKAKAELKAEEAAERREEAERRAEAEADYEEATISEHEADWAIARVQEK